MLQKCRISQREVLATQDPSAPVQTFDLSAFRDSLNVQSQREEQSNMSSGKQSYPLSFDSEEDDATPAGNQFAHDIHQADVKVSYKWSACH